jgi:hypothetical protein
MLKNFFDSYIVPYIETSFPYLFCFQCAYFTLVDLKIGKRWISVFYVFFLTLFGSSLVSVVIFAETPGWIKDSKYIIAFLFVYVVLIFLPKFLKKFLQNHRIQNIISFGMNMSIR